MTALPSSTKPESLPQDLPCPKSTPSTPSRSAARQQSIATMFANAQRNVTPSKDSSHTTLSAIERPGSPSSKKRPLEEGERGVEDAMIVEDDDFHDGNSSDRAGIQVNDTPNENSGDATIVSIANGNKRRKLTEAEIEEKERQRAQKEKDRVEKLAEKEREKEEKKRLAEETKRKKEEEKRLKEEERKKATEDRERKKEEERKAKEEKKRLEEQEKAKKEKGQTRLSSFFGKPNSVFASPSKPKPIPTSGVATVTTDSAVVPTKKTDFEKYFRPFFVKQHTSLAPQNFFVKDNEYKKYLKQKLDGVLGPQFKPRVFDDVMDIDDETSNWKEIPSNRITQAKIFESLKIPEHKRGKRGLFTKYTTKELLTKINEAEAELSLGICEEKKETPEYYLELIKSLPRKHLQFFEDVRPPYSGTFTRLPPLKSKLRSGKNPFERSLPNINYDYDSQAEWIPADEEEGEELLTEGEEDEEDSQHDDELDEFLDDDDDIVRRNAISTPLQPFCTGLCWEDSKGRNEREDFRKMKMGVLIEGILTPIDPFSTRYWLSPTKIPASKSTKPDSESISLVSSSSRPGLNFSTFNSATLSLSPRISNPLAASTSGPKKRLPPEDMEAFKKAIEGSDMTKAGLVEMLKKKFPKASKDVIRETLAMVAIRVGEREADKRWVLK